MNKYDVASVVAMNELEGENYHTLTAAQQRELFGFNVLGRKSVNFESDGQGTVRIASSKAFGTDSTVIRLTYEQFAAKVNAHEKIEV